MIKIGAAIALCALAGCTTTQQAANVMHSRWEGRPADEFFMQYGPPASTYTLTNGGKIYTWIGGRRDVVIPGATDTTVTGNVVVTTTSPPSTLALGCKAELTTDRADRIVNVQLASSIGWMAISRCAEIFNVTQ